MNSDAVIQFFHALRITGQRGSEEVKLYDEETGSLYRIKVVVERFRRI